MDPSSQVPDRELLAPPPRRVRRARWSDLPKLVFGILFFAAATALCGGLAFSVVHSHLLGVTPSIRGHVSHWWTPLLIAGGVYLVVGGVGAACILDALLGWAKERRLCRDGVAVCGEVVAVTERQSGVRRGSGYATYFTLTVRFRDSLGTERTETRPILTQDAAAFAKGMKVSILVDAQSPRRWVLYAISDYQVAP